MNAGAHGGEIKDVLVEAHGLDRSGATRVFANADMGYSYRHSAAPDDVIFTRATLQGRPGDPDAIAAEMERITRAREASQPIREKTGGSTFKNPPGMKAWELIDRAGCRGLVVGDAQVSTMHCNFLINRGHATAADLEALGEEVRRRVREASGVTLEWEIMRIGGRRRDMALRPTTKPSDGQEGRREVDEGPRSSPPSGQRRRPHREAIVMARPIAATLCPASAARRASSLSILRLFEQISPPIREVNAPLSASP